jgi:hypothetical protein
VEVVVEVVRQSQEDLVVLVEEDLLVDLVLVAEQEFNQLNLVILAHMVLVFRALQEIVIQVLEVALEVAQDQQVLKVVLVVVSVVVEKHILSLMVLLQFIMLEELVVDKVLQDNKLVVMDKMEADKVL